MKNLNFTYIDWKIEEVGLDLPNLHERRTYNIKKQFDWPVKEDDKVTINPFIPQYNDPNFLEDIAVA